MQPPTPFWLGKPRLKLKPRFDGGDWFALLVAFILTSLVLGAGALLIANVLAPSIATKWLLLGTGLLSLLICFRLGWPIKASIRVFDVGLEVGYPYRIIPRIYRVQFRDVDQMRILEQRSSYTLAIFLHPSRTLPDRIEMDIDIDRDRVEQLYEELHGLGLNVLFVEEL